MDSIDQKNCTKRKRDDRNEVSANEKKSITEFRKYLDGPDAVQYLKNFFLESNDPERIANYIHGGGSFSEIANVLTKINIKNRELSTVVFSVLTDVVLKCFTEVPDHYNLINECKQFLSSYIGELKALLTSETSRSNKKTVLQLLASIVALHSSLATLILASLSMNKEDWDSLAFHDNPQDRQSIRVSFINFILAFLIDQKLTVIEKLLSKLWLSSVFRGLRYDLPVTVIMVLATVEDKIVNATNISKTNKVKTFNPVSIGHLINLYDWNPKIWYDLKPRNVIFNEEYCLQSDKLEIRSSVHRLLLTLCTSKKLGVLFQDPNFGTALDAKNYCSSNVLENIPEPWEDDLKVELVHKMVGACPGLLIKFWHKLNRILRGDVSPLWLKIMDFITSLLKDMKLHLSNDSLSPKVYLSIAQMIFLPRETLLLIDSLMKSSFPEARLHSLKLLHVMLDIFDHESDCIVKNSSDYNDYLAEIGDYLLNNLPGGRNVLDCLKICYTERDSECITEIIRIFVLYDKICPPSIDFIRFDNTITTWIEEHTNGVSENDDQQIIALLLKLIRLDGIINPQETEKEAFLNRIILSTKAKKKADKEVAVEIIENLLTKTGFFTRDPDELTLWMYCIEKHLSPELGSCLARALKHISVSVNCQAIYAIILEALEQTNSTKEDVSRLSLDDFIELSNEETSNQKDNKNIEFFDSNNSLLNVSLLFPALLLSLPETKDISDKNNIYNFMETFIVHFLHRQTSVAAYHSLLAYYSNEKLSSVLNYVESWSVNPVVIRLPVFKNSIFEKVSRYLINNEGFNIQNEIDKESGAVLGLCAEMCLWACCRADQPLVERAASLISSLLRPPFPPLHLHRYPRLVDLFKPLPHSSPSTRTDSTPLILTLLRHSALQPPQLVPYTRRFSFELKYAKKIHYEFENNSVLDDLFKYFPLSREDVEGLIVHTFRAKNKYFKTEDIVETWSKIVNYLLLKSVEYQIQIEDDNLIELIDNIINITKKSLKISSVCDGLLKYLLSFDLDIYGSLRDLLKELFTTVCNSSEWHEDLCTYILKVTNEADYGVMPVERCVSLLASQQKYHPDHETLLSEAVVPIVNGLCRSPSPKWIQDLLKIVDPLLSKKTCKKICSGVTDRMAEVYESFPLKVLELIFKKCNRFQELYLYVLQWLEDSLNDSENLSTEKLESMCELLSTSLNGGLVEPPKTFSEPLMKGLLLRGLKLPSSPVLNFITAIVKSNVSKLPPKKIYDLMSSHSGFLDILIGNNHKEAKKSALTLMDLLIGKDSLIINARHIPVLLASYSATLSATDQVILKLLQRYQSVGDINLSCWKPYVWGEAALDHYSMRTETQPPAPHLNHGLTLDLITIQLVQETISNYPLYRGLNDEELVEERDCYDPVFMLRLLRQLTNPEDTEYLVAPRRLAASGLLAITLVSLASPSPQIRSEAYNVLFRFYNCLYEKNKDHLIWANFIGALRAGTVESDKNPRLSSIVAVFLARASIVMSYPDDRLYSQINNFFYAKPCLKLNTIPAFFEMFNNRQLNHHKLHQHWILQVIRDGMKEQQDLQLAFNSFLFKYIMDYANCVLASTETKELIEDIIVQCLKHADEKHLLIYNYSLICWLKGVKSKQIIKHISKSVSPLYKPLIDFVSKDLQISR